MAHYSIMNALSNEIYTFMMQIVNGRFTSHIINTHTGDCLAAFMMWIVDDRFA
jgi:hypothetical protein